MTPIVVGAPLRSGNWIVGGNHRRALVPIDGRSYLAQRYAIDWAMLGANGWVFEGDPKDNRSYFGYGAEVIAIADAVVESARDGIPDNVPGAPRLRDARDGVSLRAVPMTIDTVSGNNVVLRLGDKCSAFYAHLVPGSLRVKGGDSVRRGDVLGLLGNSGNSTGPHLHFHISDSEHPLAAEGLPYAIDTFDVRRSRDTWERRENEMPVGKTVVRFK
jgi:hypothetical protein